MATIVGLDLGSYSVKVVRIEARRAGDFDVVGYDEERLPPATDGAVAVPMRDRHLEALTALKQSGRLEGDVFVTGVAGDIASLRMLTFPFSDPRKIEQALPFELESEIPFDIEDVVYSWTLLGPKRLTRSPDVSGEVKPPETEVLVAFARRDAVAEHLELLEEVGIDPRHVEFDALALDDLFEGVFKASFQAQLEAGPAVTPGGTVVESGPDAPESGVAMVDIGHRRTSVCILTPERVVSAHTILHGGADATRALAREFMIPHDEAEKGKRKEAFIEVTGASAQFPEQRRISDILKTAYAPVVRRLRQVFQASMSTQRVRVVKVILVGGGSRVLNLDRHLAEALNVRVERGRDIATRLGGALPLHAGAEAAAEQGDVPEAAGALAYALSGLYGDKTRARIDFRTGEFAWRGQLDFVRERAASLGIWLVVLLVVFLAGTITQSLLLSSESDKLAERQRQACETITGQKIDSAIRCIGIIQERITGQSGFQIPEVSAADHYLETSRRVPVATVVDRKVTELDITSERIRLKANTTDFDAVDKVVAGLKGGKCFSEVEKGKARNVKDHVEFDVSVKIDCQAAPGEPLPDGQKVDTPQKPAGSRAPTRPGRSPRDRMGKADEEKLPGADGALRNLGATKRPARPPSRLSPEERRELLKNKEKDRAAATEDDLNDDDPRKARAAKKERIRQQQEAFQRLKREGKLNPGAEVGSRPVRPGMPDRMKPMRSRDGRIPLPTSPLPGTATPMVPKGELDGEGGGE